MTRIVIASTNPVKIKAVEQAFAKMFFGPAYNFIGSLALSGVSNQPKGHAETRQGAENRARNAWGITDAAFTVGIEGGIEDGPDGMKSFAWICVFDGQTTSFAQTAVFYLPHEVAQLVREGKELGEADDIVFKKDNSKQQNGAIGLLTGDAITREDYYTQAVIMALIPFKNEPLTWPSPAPVQFAALDLAIIPHAVDDLWDRTVRIAIIDREGAENRQASVRYVLPDGRLSDPFGVSVADLKPFPADRKPPYEKVVWQGESISINRIALTDPTVIEHLPGKWIDAVKRYRQLTNTHLKEAKAAIEYAKVHLMPSYLDAREVAAAEAQAVKEREFAPGTTAMHLDEPVLILSKRVNDLDRYVFFLDQPERGCEWVKVKDLRVEASQPSLEDALDTLMALIDVQDATIVRQATAYKECQQTIAAQEIDIKRQSSMIEAKNQDSVRLFNDLRQARERIDALEGADVEALKLERDRLLTERDAYRGALSRMVLERNDARDLADSLASLALEPQATPLHERGRIKSWSLVEANDAMIEDMRNDGWTVVFEQYAALGGASRFEHFVRFERLEPFPEPERDEDEAQASAAAPIPVETPEPNPVSTHEIVFGEPVPPVVVGQGSITNRLMSGESVETIKEELNRQAITRGLAAIGATLDTLEEMPDPDAPAESPALLLTAGH